ncbi:amidase [Streptomyces sp. G-5]|uniref:amidase n=1 Tax=Streptomyces sp. G-5 TaxID=2977231 RepID=UPI0021D038AE|nr:amidase [Streptomyces sp. G-5]MCU4746654.1 amidase [Streptomyces sp. G-5]
MTADEELTGWTATELTRAYAAGEVSPVDATRATLARAEAVQPELNAFVLLDHDGALEQARAAEDRWRRGAAAGPVDGVPVTVKDILLMRGQPTLRGSAALSAEGVWDEDAPAVARLRESGAVFIGKTTTPEFGWKGVTDSPRHGATGNPYAPERTAGGSSGGSAAAVRAGAGPLSLGTDGGGSVRIPGSFCGVFALKPTYGRVAIYPASAFGTLAHVGPITRDARDAALLMDVIARPDPRDWSALPATGGAHGFRTAVAGAEDTVRGLRVAYSPRLGFDGVRVEPAIAASVRRVAEKLAELGAVVEETDPPLPPLDQLREAFHVLWFAGAARVIQPFDERRRALLDPGLREICGQGAAYGSLDYLAAVDVRMGLGKAMGGFHEAYDLLLTPTMPIAPFAAGAEVPAASGMTRWTEWTPFTYPFNMTQQPAATVPCGTDAGGLPIGAQLVGARHTDERVLAVAHALDTSGATRVEDPYARRKLSDSPSAPARHRS